MAPTAALQALKQYVLSVGNGAGTLVAPRRFSACQPSPRKYSIKMGPGSAGLLSTSGNAIHGTGPGVGVAGIPILALISLQA